ncbi:hypothetical protein [Deinococcus sp. UYEF24]
MLLTIQQEAENREQSQQLASEESNRTEAFAFRREVQTRARRVEQTSERLRVTLSFQRLNTIKQEVITAGYGEQAQAALEQEATKFRGLGAVPTKRQVWPSRSPPG